ncbi:MAG TPA: (d)CMP kinase [Bacillaceae bacterium]
MEKKIRIDIDGPAAAGKSTVAKITAEKLSYIYIDTGAMYRAITYRALKENADLFNEGDISVLLAKTSIDLLPGPSGQLVLCDGADITNDIRMAEVTNSVSIVAAHAQVREEMVRRQQELARNGGVVMDGRDIGTKVLPDAELKIFLLASSDVRAERRHKENVRRGFPSDIEQLKKDIELRDKLDSEREVSPLKKAEDAIVIDTSALEINEVADKILTLAMERIECS